MKADDAAPLFSASPLRGIAAWFASIHLPAYNFKFLQCLVLIGSARLILMLAYMKTKNLWVSAGTHVINDWTIFTLVLVGAHSGSVG